jgi:sulfopyruvate decarboxylase alpha subunit
MDAKEQSLIHPWKDEIFQIFKNGGVSQVVYVPDAGHAQVIRHVWADPNMHAIPVTTEEEGVACVSGAWLGGKKAVLLMQSSGVGNCVNMFSLINNCRFPFFTIVTMRGEWAEFNQWQTPMGRVTQEAFEMMGINVLRADQPDKVVEVVNAGFDAAFQGGDAVAILLSQSLIGRKKWGVK